ncbi:MAG: alpha/beta hydrolase [Chloroflexi bacterium]|nr:alpha/beta hydrolase [Chloroflexota bacterium]
MVNPWVVEERVALVPVIGKAVAESLPHPGLMEARIRYGPHPQQTILLFWPSKPKGRRRSAVLFLHGGGWSWGSPHLFRFVGHFFAELGFPTVLGGYRLVPGFRYPAQVDDVCAGLEAGLQVFAGRGVRVEQVIAGGQSAGAQLAALLVYERSRRGWGDFHQELFGGFYSISGPLSFDDCSQPALQKMISDFTENPINREAADPIRRLRGDEQVPALLLHGERDPLVDVENTLAFAARLAQNKTCRVEVNLVKEGHHADLAGIFVEDQPAAQILKKWLLRCDRKSPAKVRPLDAVRLENRPGADQAQG